MNFPLSLLLFAALVLVCAWAFEPDPTTTLQGWLRRIRLFPAFALVITLAWYILSKSTSAAWVLAVLWFSLSLNFTSRLLRNTKKVFFTFALLLSSVTFSASLPIFAELEGRFSSEEFYFLVHLLILILTWLGLFLLLRFLRRRRPLSSYQSISPIAGIAILLVFLVIQAWAVVAAYQASFYSTQVQTYPGITAQDPFLCETLPSLKSETAVSTLLDSYARSLEQNPNKTTAEYGALALITGKQSWAARFRQELLAEAADGAFTQPENSIKYSQYEAARRLYYYLEVSQRFPQLFTNLEIESISDWLALVNQRALKIGWVDYLYALAFSHPPQGPYANQEIGAGLLSLLSNVSTPLQRQNHVFLSQAPWGWESRFRNTDDSFLYQEVWLDNAYFTAQANSQPSLNDHLKNSFDWLLVQALPDGSGLRYNNPSPAELVGTMLRAARLTNDGTYLWLAGKALEASVRNGTSLSARPGSEILFSVDSLTPSTGSCLVYGDSGLPNQVGPLAADKIVFRAGWEPASPYLLLNLRFSGWHRYKATNSIVSVYQSGPLVVEQIEGDSPSWLPAGRGLFRDKRIPRENLNGLAIPVTGLQAVTAGLTGLGSSWAQDPPFYATVEAFSTSHTVDSSTTTIRNWHGWDHVRQVSFYDEGPIVISDFAQGPPQQAASIFWHLANPAIRQDNRFIIRQGSSPAEMVLLLLEGGTILSETQTSASGAQQLQVEVRGNPKGQLTLATVFLTGKWFGSQVAAEQVDGVSVIVVQNESGQIKLPIRERP